MTPPQTPAVPPDPPAIREITELIARLRWLSAAGRDADPVDRAAFLADKDALIERITVNRADRDTNTAADGAERMTPTPRPDVPPPDPARVIGRLGHDLAALRLDYANMLAAARATLSAARDDEPDALGYLADELAAQHGQHDLYPGWWGEVGR